MTFKQLTDNQLKHAISELVTAIMLAKDNYEVRIGNTGFTMGQALELHRQALKEAARRNL